MVLLPSGLRAWTCRIAAPARQAAMPWATISSGCSGRLGLASLPWMARVRAQVIITLPVGSLITVLSFTHERHNMVHHVADSFSKLRSSLRQQGTFLLL